MVVSYHLPLAMVVATQAMEMEMDEMEMFVIMIQQSWQRISDNDM